MNKINGENGLVKNCGEKLKEWEEKVTKQRKRNGINRVGNNSCLELSSTYEHVKNKTEKKNRRVSHAPVMLFGLFCTLFPKF